MNLAINARDAVRAQGSGVVRIRAPPGSATPRPRPSAMPTRAPGQAKWP